MLSSTCSNYGKMSDPEEIVTEESALRPISLYAETKVAMEKLLLDPSATDSMCTTVLRISTVYGVAARMRFDLTVSQFTLEMAKNKHLIVFGEQFWRPYIHVRDIARSFKLILESDAGQVKNEVFNVGSTDQNYQKQTLVDMILVSVPDAQIEYVRKDEDPRDYRVSFRKIADVLGYERSRNVQDGINEVLKLIDHGVIKNFNDPNFKNS